MSEAKTQDDKTRGGNVNSFCSTGGTSVFGVDFDANTNKVIDKYGYCEADSKAKSDDGPRTLTFIDASGKSTTIKEGGTWTRGQLNGVQALVIDQALGSIATEGYKNGQESEANRSAALQRALELAGLAGAIAEHTFANDNSFGNGGN